MKRAVFWLLLLVTHSVQAKQLMWVKTTFTPVNFAWEDLQLKRSEDFSVPVGEEWIKWLREHLVNEVTAVNLCDEACEKSNLSTLDSALLLTLNITLQRDVTQGPFPEVKVSYAGGVLLQELPSRRVLYWADLPSESQVLRPSDMKQFNSTIAQASYRYPLGKLLGIKAQLEKSVVTLSSRPVRILNLKNLWQALRFQEWVKKRGAPILAQGKLESFNRQEARLIIDYQGDVQKFNSLVSAVNELESEWGVFTVDNSGPEWVITLQSDRAP